MATRRCGDDVMGARCGSFDLHDGSQNGKLSETAFAWNLVAIEGIRVSAMLIALASVILFAKPSVRAMPFVGAASVASRGPPTVLPPAGVGTVLSEARRAAAENNANDARRMA